MTPPPSTSIKPKPHGNKAARARFTAALGMVAVLSVLAAACGGGNDGNDSPTAGQPDAAEAAERDAAEQFLSTRPGIGIVAAGGTPAAVSGSNPCEQPAGASGPLTIAYVGANLAQLEAIGLEALTIEEPRQIITAYVNEINFNGGINGRCVELVEHLWSLADPAASFTQICTELPAQQPVFHFTLGLWEPIVECATIGAQIPTIGLYSSAPSTLLARTADRLFLDDGSIEQLLTISLDVGLASQVIGPNDRMGLLHGDSEMQLAVDIIDGFGLDRAAMLHVPPEFGDLQLLLVEGQVRLLESGLTELEQAEADRNRAALPPELAGAYEQIEQFFLAGAEQFKTAGVTAVAVTADWTNMRRLMRAAEIVEWYPTWLSNDIQPASIVLADVPDTQAANVVMISNRRAAGDEVPDLDNGCLTLRNTAVQAEPFSHRLHTDAWGFMSAVCDYLDVAFGAMTRVQEPITADTFTEALQDTRYNTGYGGRITFGPADVNGADRFRVLQADPECVLNFWGCMRSTTDWIEPSVSLG